MAFSFGYFTTTRHLAVMQRNVHEITLPLQIRHALPMIRQHRLGFLKNQAINNDICCDPSLVAQGEDIKLPD
jgi:hypothetical protein